MATATRAFDRGTALADQHKLEVGQEFRERRLMLSLSQEHVARSARISRLRYSRIENARLPASIVELDRIAAVLGLQISLRVYPGGAPVRDAAHSDRLQAFLADVRPPLKYRIEVPLPRIDRSDGRAWDAMVFSARERAAVELEMRLRDIQAMRRRHDLKRRDDPTEAFLLLVADTRANRRLLREFESLFVDLPRHPRSALRETLLAGRLPPTGLALV